MAGQRPHRRLNRLTGEWLLVSPQRTTRPWQGLVERPRSDPLPRHDPACYLCPGNERATGSRTPEYRSTYVFDNDFPALLPDTPAEAAPIVDSAAAGALLIAVPERGRCRVICYSPRHDLTLGAMDVADIAAVVDAWVREYAELGDLDWVGHVQIFENRGALMGASNPHPHGQIWANERLPNEPAKELRAQRRYAADEGGCLLCDYLALESGGGERVVCANEHFVALVPFWAEWPFEALVLSRAHRGALPDLDTAERAGLADILRRLTRRYDRLFEVTFPYSMGFHQRPTDGAGHPEWHLHAHFYPPLLRSATVRKFVVGYELLGQPQRDISPELAAQRLRDLPAEP